MEPAYEIPLDKDQLALIGEIVAILSIIDDEMVKQVQYLEKNDVEIANKKMKSSQIEERSKFWCRTIQNSFNLEDLKTAATQARDDIQRISKERNGYVHAVFEANYILLEGRKLTLGGLPLVLGPTQARHFKTTTTRPITDLKHIRDEAAKLSCTFAHIGHIARGNPPEESPWRDRV